MILGVLAVVFVGLALGSGVWWVLGGVFYFADFGLLNWHILLGFVLTALIGLHMWARVKPLRARDMSGRRNVLRFGLLVVAPSPSGRRSRHSNVSPACPAPLAASPARARPTVSPAISSPRRAGLPTRRDRSSPPPGGCASLAR